jgi:hypothetical protein
MSHHTVTLTEQVCFPAHLNLRAPITFRGFPFPVRAKQKPQPVSRFLAGAKSGTYNRKRRPEARRSQLHQTEELLRVDDGDMKSPSQLAALAGAKFAIATPPSGGSALLFRPNAQRESKLTAYRLTSPDSAASYFAACLLGSSAGLTYTIVNGPGLVI